MDNAKQHWPILQNLGTDLENKVREFWVFGNDGDGVIVATEDGLAYLIMAMKLESVEPTLLNVQELVSMARSVSHILLLNKRGQIYSMGENDEGQLGLGSVDQKSYFPPQIISSQHKFISVRCGNAHSLALTEDGKVWAWGLNNYGQVGVPGLTKSLPSLRQIPELDHHRIVAVECGGGHSLALTDQGEVYSWGYNEYGQLGDGCELSTHTPTRIPTPSPVQSMAASHAHTLLLTIAGEVYSCGDNRYGLLGLPTTTKFSSRLSKVAGLPPISQIASQSITNLSIAMSSDHRCFVWGKLRDETSLSTPLELPPVYSTVESPLSFFSTYRTTPHSVTLPARECSSRTDSTTQTELCPDSVPNQTPLKPILHQMFNNPDSNPDIQFQFKDQTILAHRCVLLTSSGHFRRLFSSSTPDLNPPSSVTSQSGTSPSPRHTTNPSNPKTDTTPHSPQVTILIPDHSYPAFYAYIRFLYLNIFKVAPEHLADLFSISVDYLESDLQQLCLSRMRTTLTPATCCLYYPLTHRHSFPELSAFQQELVQFISTRTSEVYLSDAYQSMDGELCKKLSISIVNLTSN